jgi:hypothetical protein
MQTTLMLTNDTGTIIGTDLRQTRFRFTHDQLFHAIRGVDFDKYIGFNIALLSQTEQNTGTAPTNTNNSRVSLLRVSTAMPTANRIVDDNTYIMNSYILTNTASLYCKYYAALGSSIFCSFNNEYEFIVTLSGGATAAQIAAYTGTASYLPTSFNQVYIIQLIPKLI